jgi:anti-sigma regulatory factor (Ser/Thr protein kinase)
VSRPPEQPVHLTIRSTPAHLRVVRATVEAMCRQLGFTGEDAGHVVLGTDEALTNIIRHAYDGRHDQRIDIELAPRDAPGEGGIRIRLRDYGRPIDPRAIRARDLHDVRPGGLGVHIMGTCMDRVDYRPADGGGTVLTMVRTLREGQKGTPQ